MHCLLDCNQGSAALAQELVELCQCFLQALQSLQGSPWHDHTTWRGQILPNFSCSSVKATVGAGS